MSTEVYSVVGVTFDHRQDILSNFYKNYRHGGIYEIFLNKEDDNPYDANAISVSLELNGKLEQVGYIPKNKNVELRKKMSEIKSSKIKSMGVTATGDIGLSIVIEY